MRTLKRVLALTDLSAPARHGVERAAMVARESGASLDVAHVVPLPPIERARSLVGGLPPAVPQRLVDNASASLRTLAGELRARQSIDANVRVTSGALLAEIARLCDEVSAELVVLGARGAGFLRHLLLGSTAERLIRMSTRSLLVVKEAPRTPYQNVLVAIDFSDSTPSTLEWARTVAPQARLHLLHAYEAAFEGKLLQAGVDDESLRKFRDTARQEALDRMDTLTRRAGPRVAPPLVLHGNAVLRILEQEQEQDCDLVAIGKHGAGRIEELLVGSVTRYVLSASQSDVLISR